MSECVDYLNLLVKLVGDRPFLAKLLKDHGTSYGPVLPCPDAYAGPPRQCYRNAALMAIYCREYTYVEGYAVPQQVGFPMEHAWVVDARRRVIDPTWKDQAADSEYFGIAFRRKFLLDEVIRREAFGLLISPKMARRLCEHPSVLRKAKARIRIP